MAGNRRPARPKGEGSIPAKAGPRIGVLALQGAFREHAKILRSLGAVVDEVRLPRELEGLSGLVIPGGESTTMGLLMEQYGLMDPLRTFAQKHPVFGTCAGLIMLAERTVDGEQPLLGVMDVTVRRNAFGRQPRSFEAPVELHLSSEPEEAFHGIFIRAPWVEVMGSTVEAIAHCDGRIVGVRQDHLVAVAFHPELGTDTRLHSYFLAMVGGEGAKRAVPE